MGDVTGIGWTDATFNSWMGCTEAGPGCDLCFARTLVRRRMGLDVWGAHKPRKRTSSDNWRKPERWHRMHERGVLTMRHEGKDVPVPVWCFCGSLMDFCDNQVPVSWRADTWALIKRCHHLRWQLVTKRIGNMVKMLPADWQGGKGYEHVGVVASVCTQAELHRDIGRLLALKLMGVRWVGLSIEPQLERIDLALELELVFQFLHDQMMSMGLDPANMPGLDWVIIGGESDQDDVDGQPAYGRPFDLAWGMLLLEQCTDLGIPAFMKQLGSTPKLDGKPYAAAGSGTDPTGWPAPMRVQQMPTVYGAPARTVLL